jgi:hypothetical protein
MSPCKGPTVTGPAGAAEPAPSQPGLAARPGRKAATMRRRSVSVEDSSGSPSGEQGPACSADDQQKDQADKHSLGSTLTEGEAGRSRPGSAAGDDFIVTREPVRKRSRLLSM